MDNIGIATRIQTMRMSRGISQTKLAEMVGVSRSAIAMWEAGKRIPSWDAINALADAFNVRPSSIYEDENPDEDKELWELRESLRQNPDMRILFSLAKDAKPKALKQAIAIVKALNEDE